MKTPETNDPLDALLRDDNAHLADGGFTARVMTSLPSRRRNWLRPAILLGISMAGFALVLLWAPSFKDIMVAKPDGGFALHLTGEAQAGLGALLVAAGALLWSAFAAVRWVD
jgi:hypothetical protein